MAVCLAVLAVGTARVQAAGPTDASAKIDPAVWLLLERGPAPVLIEVVGPKTLTQPLPKGEGPEGTQGKGSQMQGGERLAALKADAAAAQGGVRRALADAAARGGASHVEGLWIIDAVAATVDADTLLALAARPDVTYIRADRAFRIAEDQVVTTSVVPPSGEQKPSLLDGLAGRDVVTTSVVLQAEERLKLSLPGELEGRGVMSGTVTAWGVQRIGADRVWQDFGLRGEGVTVAVVDTGAQWTHPALRGSYLGADGNHAYAWFDATGESPTVPVDPLSHGTHVLGTIVGEDATHHVGVAPGTRWMAVRIFDHNGVSYESRVHRAFQWLLAPTDLAGQNPDPSRAPKVVNFSWGSDSGANDVYAADIARLRAGGIVATWSAGNNGLAGAGTIGSPAALADAFAVGAVDQADAFNAASGQGPAFDGRLKPDVTAPGVAILSTVPTDTFSLGTGTSMAAPHTAGTAALLLQANPRLSVDDVERLMRLTAVDLGDPGPDNRFGAGRIDAYKAVSWARSAGQMAGRVTGLLPTEPVSMTLRGARRSDGVAFASAVGADGSYTVTVPAGVYDVTADALGYLSPVPVAVTVETGSIARADLALTPAPRYSVTGYVARQATGEALAATVAVPNTPFRAETNWAGAYHMALPAGTYTLEARAPHTRIERVSVTVDANHPSARANILLSDAPSILLVDADTWRDEQVMPYYRRALADAGFVHDTWVVSDTRAFGSPATRPVVRLPDVATLRRYDIVVWVHSAYSPGVLAASTDGAHDAVGALRGYLTAGGRVLLIGQNIGFFDVQGGWGRTPLAPDFYRDALHARFVADDAGAQTAAGTSGSIFDGLTVQLSAPGGYRRNPDWVLKPDVVDALGSARVVMGYTAENGAAVAAASEPSRLLYLAFALDGAAREEQAETLRRALAWLSEPRTYRVFMPLVQP